MIKYLKNVSIFIGLIFMYKLITFVLLIPTFASEGINQFYGKSSDRSKIILVGSSNLEHNIDYGLLNDTFDKFDVIGCNLNAPSGLYATLHKLKRLKPSQNDVIIFCLPHNLYNSEYLLPLSNNQKVGFNFNMTFNSFIDFPMESLKSLSLLNLTDVYDIGVKRGYFNKIENVQINSFSIAPKIGNQDYFNCKTSEDDKFHINELDFEENYLDEVYAFISGNFNSCIFFRFPAVKMDDFDINDDRLNYLLNNFKFMNKFENSIYPKEYWYNQWYHLNSCGRDLNTEKLIKELKRLPLEL